MHGHFWHTSTVRNRRSLGCILLLNQIYLTTVVYRSTIPHRFISLICSGNEVRIRLDLELHYFSIFLRRITKTSTLSSANFTEGNTLLKVRTKTMNNKIRLHILGVLMNKLGN